MFVVEEIFGFNEQTPRLCVRDQVVSLAVTLVFTALIGVAVVAVVDAFPGVWWIGAWALFVAYQLVTGPWLYELFGLASGAGKPLYAGLFLAALVLEPLNRLTSPLENKLSLAHEREADAFAVEVMGDGEPMVDALCRLAIENLSNPFPHPLYEAFHYTHPPIPDRVRNIRRRSGSAEAETDGTLSPNAG